MAGDRRIRIIVDSRERNRELIDAIGAKGVEVELRPRMLAIISYRTEYA